MTEKMMDKLRVKITGSKSRRAWYAYKVGQSFDVYDRGRDFVVAADYDKGADAPWRWIEKVDCVVVEKLVEVRDG